jgi:hypothetical protein
MKRSLSPRSNRFTFQETAKLLHDIRPEMKIPAAQLDGLIEAMSLIDKLPNLDRLLECFGPSNASGASLSSRSKSRKGARQSNSQEMFAGNEKNEVSIARVG